jgi:hypothetical protein
LPSTSQLLSAGNWAALAIAPVWGVAALLASKASTRDFIDFEGASPYLAPLPPI